ncbi:DUF3073 domain-containing protein [Pseudonocardiaceae bacterium YIM PH 21723]|nr:DUF3073 domain-containing protein [Pseudonocardiaceae bacterium YIM PH 21723]
MGRGRAKAKQTKVARELKYSSPTTDFTALQRELSVVEEREAAEARAREAADSRSNEDRVDEDPYEDYR